MSSYLKNKFKNNKEIFAASIASLTSLAVALILGYVNLTSTEKQIANQLDIQKNQITHQNELLKEQINKERTESEARNKSELERINLMQKNSIELLNQQIVKEIKRFNERKFKESQEETQKAANYISSDILVKLVTLKGFALIKNRAEILTSDAYLLPEAINQSNKRKFEILSAKEISPPATYIEKLPVNQMTECLKFYNQYSIFNKAQSSMNDLIKDMEKTFSSQTTQELERMKIFFKKNDDEIIQWMRNYRLAMANSIECGAAEGAVDTMETGIKTLDSLNKITNNKQTYDFDPKKMREQVQKRSQLADNELKIFLQTFNLSYPQLKDRIENSDGKKTK